MKYSLIEAEILLNDHTVGREVDLVSAIYVVPVGNVKVEILTRIIPCLEERFLFKFRLLASLALPEQAYDGIKKKYLSTSICFKIRQSVPFDAKYVLGITDADTFEESANLTYNLSSNKDDVGLVSIYRYRSAEGKDSNNEDIFFQRILKEAIHEVGHLMGFRHCFNNNCVMYFSYSINDTDRKGAFFCQECEKKLNMIQNS